MYDCPSAGRRTWEATTIPGRLVVSPFSSLRIAVYVHALPAPISSNRSTIDSGTLAVSRPLV